MPLQLCLCHLLDDWARALLGETSRAETVRITPHQHHVTDGIRILRIILFDVVLSVSAFFSTYFYISEGYVHPLAIYYEGFAMTAIFLLLVQYACPDPYDRAQYFTNLERHWVNGKVKKGSKGSLRWFRVRAESFHVVLLS